MKRAYLLTIAIVGVWCIAATASAADAVKTHLFDIIAAAEGKLVLGSPDATATWNGEVYQFQKGPAARPALFLTYPYWYLARARRHRPQLATGE